jgi:hypothetical protein
MTATIRLATPHDAAGVQAIYAPVVRETAISFELKPPTVGEMEKRIAEMVARMPWLVCERRGEILGYAYASPSRRRDHRQRVCHRRGHPPDDLTSSCHMSAFRALPLMRQPGPTAGYRRHDGEHARGAGLSTEWAL